MTCSNCEWWKRIDGKRIDGIMVGNCHLEPSVVKKASGDTCSRYAPKRECIVGELVSISENVGHVRLCTGETVRINVPRIRDVCIDRSGKVVLKTETGDMEMTLNKPSYIRDRDSTFPVRRYPPGFEEPIVMYSAIRTFEPAPGLAGLLGHGRWVDGHGNPVQP